MTQNSPNITEDPVGWGRQLILTHDHDPLYSGLLRAFTHGLMDRDRLRRYLIAYWSCYHVGASWWVSEYEGDAFWAKMRLMARNESQLPPPIEGLKRWPRGMERRHWRGQRSIDSVDWLKEHYPKPEQAVLDLEQLHEPSLKDVEAVVTSWPMFGPWITFKAADMLERVMGVPVRFPRQVTTMYNEPRKGASLFGQLLGIDDPQKVSDYLVEQYSDMPAPPFGDRACNVQEVETVLCKGKSCYKGHYYVGKDTEEQSKALLEWKAYDLLECYPVNSEN